MKFSNIIGAFFVSALMISTCAFADSGSSGDSTRERGSNDNDRGAPGEMNHDNDTQRAEGISSSQRSTGHPVRSLGIGEPSDPDYSYNKNKEEMMGHD